MEKLLSSEAPSHWHSAPLVFAILPAVGGLLFQNGSAVVTDILLLGLGSMFLNWCVRSPWDWYHSAQQVQVIEPESGPYNSTIIEEESEEDEEVANVSAEKPRNAAQEAAASELGRDEIFALIACFVGPILGAYLLHTIRSQLTRPSEGLVSNYNLTIFVMAAELRPFSHLIKMKHARMLHLQRIVKPDLNSSEKLAKTDAQELSKRLTEIEARLADSTANSGIKDNKVLEMSTSVRQSLQPQLDALNRAVRRYEKRSAAQSIQTEARFADLEVRLKDALSLAAAAARSGQKPGVIAVALNWISSTFMFWAQAFWSVCIYPFQLGASILVVVKSWFISPKRSPRKRDKAKSDEHGSISGSRMQSKSGR